MYLLASSLAAALPAERVRLGAPGWAGEISRLFEQPENEAEHSCDATGFLASAVNKLFVNSLLTRATIL